MRRLILFGLAALMVLASPHNPLLAGRYEDAYEMIKRQHEQNEEYLQNMQVESARRKRKQQEESAKRERERAELRRCDGPRQVIEAKMAMGKVANSMEYFSYANCLPPGTEKSQAQGLGAMLSGAKWVVCTNRSVFSCTRCLVPQPLLFNNGPDSVCPGTSEIFDNDMMAENWIGLNCCK